MPRSYRNKRVKIKTSNNTTGRPGGWGHGINRFTGKFVGKSRVAKGSVTRLLARNPADGKTANIGTKRDVNPLVAANQQAIPSPRTMKAPNDARNATATHKGIGNRGVTNRSIRRTNS
jgi:hypothetical protein